MNYFLNIKKESVIKGIGHWYKYSKKKKKYEHKWKQKQYPIYDLLQYRGGEGVACVTRAPLLTP